MPNLNPSSCWIERKGRAAKARGHIGASAECPVVAVRSQRDNLMVRWCATREIVNASRA
jgi:hypothetical protein